MALYMVQFAYTPEAWATLVKNPQDRSVAGREAVQKRGGRLVGFYYCFGEYDGVAITEAPDDSVALAGAMALIAPGHLKAIKTTKLFSVEESMEAMRKAGSPSSQAASCILAAACPRSKPSATEEIRAMAKGAPARCPA